MKEKIARTPSARPCSRFFGQRRTGLAEGDGSVVIDPWCRHQDVVNAAVIGSVRERFVSLEVTLVVVVETAPEKGQIHDLKRWNAEERVLFSFYSVETASRLSKAEPRLCALECKKRTEKVLFSFFNVGTVDQLSKERMGYTAPCNFPSE
jgi:hypothetical protein